MPVLAISPRISLHYLEFNSTGSPTLVLLHGLGATGESWILQIPPLTEANYRIIAPDVRGFGKSSYPGGSVRIAQFAGDLAVLLNHLEIDRAGLIGISMGGTIALQFALDCPQLVWKLVLVNTFSSLRPDRLNVWLYFALRFVLVHTMGLPWQARAVAKRIFPHPSQADLRNILIEQICQADPRGYRAAMRALGLFNVTSRLGEIGCPTLVVTAAGDTTVPPKNQRLLVDKIPSSRQVIIPDAGHAVTVDQPEAFNQVLLEFLTTP